MTIHNKTTDDKVIVTEASHTGVQSDEAAVPVADPATPKSDNPRGSYEGRKHEPQIDGPEQVSQETDEVYADPRKEENLPAGGKNVADLNAHDLSQGDSDG